MVNTTENRKRASRARTDNGRIDKDELKRLATGRWPEILSRVGRVNAQLLDGKNHPCPKCGGKDRFRLLNREAGALFCNQCFNRKNGDGLAAIGWLRGVEFTDANRRSRNANQTSLRTCGRCARPTVETAVRQAFDAALLRSIRPRGIDRPNRCEISAIRDVDTTLVVDLVKLLFRHSPQPNHGE